MPASGSLPSPPDTQPEISMSALHIGDAADPAAAADRLFDPSLLHGYAPNLPADFVLRPLEIHDFDKGFLSVLAELTSVGTVTEKDFEAQFRLLQRKDTYILVIEHLLTSKIAASGSLVVEHKFIHGCNKIGHIEDIVVSAGWRGKNFGLVMIEGLKSISKRVGNYKTILACLEKNVPFYEKCGLKAKEVSMAIYHPENDKP